MRTLRLFLPILALCGFQDALAQGTGWTWQNPLPQGNTLHAVHFADAASGWAVGDAGTILHTADGGQTWTVQDSNTARTLADVHFTDGQAGWIVGDRGTILHTGDGGATWRAQASGTSFRFYDVEPLDALTAWVVGGEGTILRTTDGGVTWTSQPSGTPNALLGIDFLDAETGWISGAGGTILRFTGNATGTAAEDETDAPPEAFALAQNYPNPFNPSTTIRFTVPEAGRVRLQVFDVLGRLVVTLADGPHAAGRYTVTWQAGAAPSGVYVYRLQTATHTEEKTMILLR
ncbi:MAG: YCF48-related protein [Rhodothermales bacterium]|nr:YCF48-related protein [Rhodothermales bacterium]